MAHLRTPPSFLQHHAQTKSHARNDGFAEGATDGDPGNPAAPGTDAYNLQAQRMPKDGWYLNQNWQKPGSASMESLDAQAKEELAAHSASQQHGAADEGADENFMQFKASDMSKLPPPMFPTAFNTRANAAAGAKSTVNPVPSFALHQSGSSRSPFAPEHAPSMVAAGAIAKKLASQAKPTQFLQTAAAQFAAPPPAREMLSGAFPSSTPPLHGADAGADFESNPALNEVGATRSIQQQAAQAILTRERAIKGRPAPSDATRARMP